MSSHNPDIYTRMLALLLSFFFKFSRTTLILLYDTESVFDSQIESLLFKTISACMIKEFGLGCGFPILDDLSFQET